MTTAQTVGQTIASALKARRLTQSAFAKKIGAPKSSVHAWVHDQEEPRLGTLERIAEGLDTSVAELMAGRWRRVRRVA